MSDLPIGDYAFLSDCHTAALVSRAGSVDWLCFPRFDGPAVFARLLDERAGSWSIQPAGEYRVRRRYLDGSLVLETSFETDTGAATLTDALALGRHERGHELGNASPGVLLRVVACTRGAVEFQTAYAPRPEYGLVHPLLEENGGALVARGGAEVLTLSGSVPVEPDGATAGARFRLREGERATFALQHRATWQASARPWTTAAIRGRLADTLRAWRTWCDLHQSYQGPWRDLVHHSGRVLQGLTFQPTGAFVAAPTTSLPEQVGGGRNWDYRYCWLRDASLTLDALWVAACPDEAHQFFGWMAAAAAANVGQDADLQVMFGVGGEHDLSERTLDHLAGWRGSRPVRVGNAAWRQRQLDVYGELLGAARRLADDMGRLDRPTQQFLVGAADKAAARWREPDHGIWEMRGAPRHFLYSKLLCWAALDCALALADRLDARERLADWTAARGEIRQAIEQQGWSERAGAFTQAFGSDELDASALMLPIVGFLPGDDPRVRSTIDAIAERLTDDRGLVYRYRSMDGLEGREGTFLLCTFWLAHALAVAGEEARAAVVFERAIAHANDVGLLAEEVDSATGELLGNFPQAFSHIGLVNAAWAIAQARQQGTATAEGPTHTG